MSVIYGGGIIVLV